MNYRLRLTDNESAMLSGARGRAVGFAMEIVVNAARIERATELIPISFAHIDSCFYSGRAHLDFVNFLLDNDARLSVPSWTNNGLVSLNDLSIRDPLGSREMQEARELMLAYQRLGCRPVWTCAPYQLPGRPQPGDHIVGSESNAVSFYNSVVGARTNKYGDFFDVCAAVCGCVPNTGLHLSENRRARVIFDVDAIDKPVRQSDLFFHLLGHYIGRKCGNDVPAIIGLLESTDEDDLKAISAAGSSSGSVPLFHAVGITPEARTLDMACQNEEVDRVIVVEPRDLQTAREELSQKSDGKLSGVALGTPHFSITEFEKLVGLLSGRSIHPSLLFYLTTSRHVYEMANRRGLTQILEDAGIKIITDTCTYFSPAVNGLEGLIMTNAAKWAYYAPGMLPVEVVLGSLSECVESAVAGKVMIDRWAPQ